MKQKLLAAILLFMGLSGAALAQSQGSSVAVTSWAGGTLGPMANFGSSPGAVLVPGANVDTPTSSNLYTALTAAVPALNATAYNTNSYSTGTTNPLNADLNGNLYVNFSRYLGTAGSANASPLTVQGIASMTPILANPGTAANWGVVATGAAPPANGVYLATNQSGATGGHVGGLISCDNHVFKHITTATDTLAVQGVASQTIYICGWRARAAGVATWFLENTASANANCSSSNTQITGVATEAANTGEVNQSAFWNGLKNTSGNGLCINSTGTGGVDVDVWYTQF